MLLNKHYVIKSIKKAFFDFKKIISYIGPIMYNYSFFSTFKRVFLTLIFAISERDNSRSDGAGGLSTYRMCILHIGYNLCSFIFINKAKKLHARIACVYNLHCLH